MKELGRYEILEEIGRGAFAVVYRARDTEFLRIVALKVLHPQLTVDPKFVERFKREAHTAAGLDHPNIATVYEVGDAGGQLYIAMEPALGPSLAARIQEQGPLPWEEALEILEQLASALDYAHEQGFVHRDVKPSNILLDPDKGALLGDFGLSKMIESSGYSLTASGGVLGTPAYIAPEIWAGERPTPASDIYALGCVLCEIITGEVLFGTDSPLVVMKRHDDGPQLDVSKVEEGLRAVLLKALAKTPGERYQQAGQFAAALRGKWDRLEAEREEAERQERIATLIAQGRQAAREKRWDKAVASFETVLALDGGHRVARRALSRSQRARERAKQARRVPGWAWALGALTVVGFIVFLAAVGGLMALVVPREQTPGTSPGVPESVVANRSPTSFRTISLETAIADSAESTLEEPRINLQLEPGIHELASVPVDFGWTATTQYGNAPDSAEAVEMNVNIPLATAVHFLIQAGNGFIRYDQQQVGSIRLHFGDGSTTETPLILGYNIRDWTRGESPDAVTTVTSDDVTEAWSGTEEGKAGGMDILTVRIPEQKQLLTLIRTEVLDTSREAMSSLDPAIHLLAVTVSSAWVQSVDQIPASGSQIVWDLDQGQVLMVTGGRMQAGEFSCLGGADRICVVIIEATETQQIVINDVIAQNNWLGITDHLSPKEVLASVQPGFWEFPNCGQGCSTATVGFFVDDLLVETKTISP